MSSNKLFKISMEWISWIQKSIQTIDWLF